MATAVNRGKPTIPVQPVGQCSVRPRIDKLGIKPGFRVAVIGVDDAALMDELRTRTDQIVIGKPRDRRDAIFYGADSLFALEALESLKERIVASGAIWVVSRKGADRSLNETEVIAAAKRAGLVDNKVVSFSPTHTALRLVIPLAWRK